MNKLKANQILAVVALLLGSSIASAATVNVTPSVANPVPLGPFSVMVSSPDMPTTTGATLDVLWNPAVISIGTAVPIAPNFNFAVFTPTGPGTGLVSVISTSALGVAGPFDAFTLNLTAIGAGSANLVFAEGDADKGWSDVNAVNLPGVTYANANIVVGGEIPVPAAAWLFLSAVGGLVTLKRRQLA